MLWDLNFSESESAATPIASPAPTPPYNSNLGALAEEAVAESWRGPGGITPVGIAAALAEAAAAAAAESAAEAREAEQRKLPAKKRSLDASASAGASASLRLPPPRPALGTSLCGSYWQAPLAAFGAPAKTMAKTPLPQWQLQPWLDDSIQRRNRWPTERLSPMWSGASSKPGKDKGKKKCISSSVGSSSSSSSARRGPKGRPRKGPRPSLPANPSLLASLGPLPSDTMIRLCLRGVLSQFTFAPPPPPPPPLTPSAEVMAAEVATPYAFARPTSMAAATHPLSVQPAAVPSTVPPTVPPLSPDDVEDAPSSGGEPASVQVKHVLSRLRLEKYAGILDELGYDDVHYLRSLSTERLATIAMEAQMRSGHVAKFSELFHANSV